MSLFRTALRCLSWPVRPQTRRPLAYRRPSQDPAQENGEVPLGLEATDLDLIDRVNTRNDALERSGARHSIRGIRFGQSYMQRSSLHIAAMPEDETYATRFFRAFQKKVK